MRIMISGSIAYDNILSYGGRFSDHLVRESLDHINLTFVTDSMTRNYGGCAANIAYALKLLAATPSSPVLWHRRFRLSLSFRTTRNRNLGSQIQRCLHGSVFCDDRQDGIATCHVQPGRHVTRP